MGHICVNEKEIGAMQNSIGRFEKELFGNGKEGLTQTVPVLTAKIDVLVNTVEGLRVTVSGFARFEADMIAQCKAQKELEERGNRSYSKNLKTAGTVIAFIGMASAMFFGFKNMSRQNRETRTYIESVMEPVVMRGIHYDPFASDSIE